MKVISISADPKLFEDESEVLGRFIDYSKNIEELHVVVFTNKNRHYESKRINNLYIHPTNSSLKFFYVKHALKIASKIITDNHFSASDSVITTQDPFLTGLTGLKLKRKFIFPLQVQIHTDFLSRHYSGSINTIRKFIARKVLKNATRIRVVSEVIKESLITKYPFLKEKIDVLPVFVDIEKIVNTRAKRDLNNDFPKFKFIILMASRITKEKRYDVALEVLKKVLHKYPRAGLLIAGDGPEKDNIERMAKRMKIREHVVFLGWQNDLISLYKTSNVFLLTSDFEGYGMTLIEAGASGGAIVSTKVGIAKTGLFLDGVNSHICPVGDTECLSKNIVSIIEDNQKRELFGSRIQNDIKNQSISKEEYVSRYVGLLKDLLGKV